jgi:hypothetical protein
MKAFKDKFVTRWDEEIVKPLEKEMGVKFSEYTALAQGVMTLAITQEGFDGKNDKEPAFVVLMDSRDKSEDLKKHLAELKKKWTDAGKKMRTEKIRDTEFSVVTLTTNDVPKSLKQYLPSQPEVTELGKEPAKPRESRREVVIGQFESALIIGSTPAVVEKVMTRLTGGQSPALADDAVFEANRAAAFRDASMYGWINLKRIMEMVMKIEAPKENPDAPSMFPQFDPATIVKALGLAGLNGASFAYGEMPEGSAVDMYIGVPEATRAGLTKLMTMEPKDASAPAFVPADAVQFQRIRFDGQKGIATIEKAVKDISPAAFTSWDFMLKTSGEALKEKIPDFDVRKDLFGNLGDDIIVYAKAPKGTTVEALTSQPQLVLIGSPNAEKLASAIRAVLVFTSPDAMTPKEREFLGKKIYSITSPTMPMAMSSGSGSLHYSASGGYLAFSSDSTMIEEYLRSGEKPPKGLRDTAGLADAAQKAGGSGTGMFSYDNQAESLKLLFTLLKKAGAGGESSGLDLLTGGLPIAGPESSLKEWMDFSLLPEFEKVAKYFHFSVTSGASTKDGLSLKIFSPTPPALKK